MNKLLVIFLLVSNTVFSQSVLDIHVLAGNNEVSLGEPFTVADNSYQLQLLKFYITNLRFLNNGSIVADFSEQPQLINFEDDSTRHILLSTTALPEFDEIRFTFGVDSLTNTSGAMSGALDPVNGMYWTWQSGYINCKIEGEIISAGHQSVEYHLGGYLPNQLAAQEIILPANYTSGLSLEFHLDAILSNLGNQNLFRIMSPGENAVMASELIVESVQIGNK